MLFLSISVEIKQIDRVIILSGIPMEMLFHSFGASSFSVVYRWVFE